MKRSRYTDSEILSILKQSEAGIPIPDLCRKQGISSAAFYKRRGKPKVIRYDNGPEYISKELKIWASKAKYSFFLFSPEIHRQNAYVKRYHRTVLCDWPSQHLLANIAQIQLNATQWL